MDNISLDSFVINILNLKFPHNTKDFESAATTTSTLRNFRKKTPVKWPNASKTEVYSVIILIWDVVAFSLYHFKKFTINVCLCNACVRSVFIFGCVAIWASYNIVYCIVNTFWWETKEKKPKWDTEWVEENSLNKKKKTIFESSNVFALAFHTQ